MAYLKISLSRSCLKRVQNMHVCTHFRVLGVPKRPKRDKKEAKRGSKNTKSPISKQYDVIEVLKLHQMIAKVDI